LVEARQSAVASYTREGFQAAAVTAMMFPQSGHQVVRRTLTLRFNRPYAAVAVAGIDHEAGRHTTARFALPVFSAWVAEPTETPTPPPDPSPFGL
jgi:hypothetical protein